MTTHDNRLTVQETPPREDLTAISREHDPQNSHLVLAVDGFVSSLFVCMTELHRHNQTDAVAQIDGGKLTLQTLREWVSLQQALGNYFKIMF